MSLDLTLTDPDQTAALAESFAHNLSAGDTVLLAGDVGAGKSVFARALIQARMAELGLVEDVPSPTFTLVQTYNLQETEVWHADLYRLTHADELIELGLDDAFESAICLIEWSDRLGSIAPKNALGIQIKIEPNDTRVLNLEWSDPKWDSIVQNTLQRFQQDK